MDQSHSEATQHLITSDTRGLGSTSRSSRPIRHTRDLLCMEASVEPNGQTAIAAITGCLVDLHR